MNRVGSPTIPRPQYRENAESCERRRLPEPRTEDLAMDDCTRALTFDSRSEHGTSAALLPSCKGQETDAESDCVLSQHQTRSREVRKLLDELQSSTIPSVRVVAVATSAQTPMPRDARLKSRRAALIQKGDLQTAIETRATRIELVPGRPLHSLPGYAIYTQGLSERVQDFDGLELNNGYQMPGKTSRCPKLRYQRGAVQVHPCRLQTTLRSVISSSGSGLLRQLGASIHFRIRGGSGQSGQIVRIIALF